ncbi:hypothetical protein H5154_00020 [Pseudoalteromonas sp. SR44-5]|uniref:hypothetical protein n=1 Tax=Pseudoalteromonas TaxID=53246 RepID=UPI0012304C2E|nr:MULTISPECIES: hypothetical protein [Pseudoalteromonas]MBB1333040.1 hypothetical protein [Pseudoalteromonas sp. SR41-6]MBB1340586.1 hypothetical protein [Pseudoalteromonas sp. SR45-6]MBB1364784.1 hypothetical protein [Pseudoalteromonas sp. SR44-5]MBB1415651.1 hypothetical protein [Pseudoalteromonas sp. SG44-1]MBB1433549.1 hypothetical protein [Pseudoalteromonas sp. SG43-6]
MSLSSVTLALLGAFLTFYLAKHNRLDAIRASAILAIIAYLILLTTEFNAELYSSIFFGGTFIGMSAPKRFGIYTLFSASVIFSILFDNLVPYLSNFGGALGISGFLSICVCQIAIVLGAPRSKKRH